MAVNWLCGGSAALFFFLCLFFFLFFCWLWFVQPNGNLVVSGLNTGWETHEMRNVIAKWKSASFMIWNVPPCGTRKQRRRQQPHLTQVGWLPSCSEFRPSLRCFHGNSLTLPCVGCLGDQEWDSSEMDGQLLMMRGRQKAGCGQFCLFSFFPVSQCHKLEVQK